MQTVNLLTIVVYQTISAINLMHLFIKTRFKIFSRWLVLARFVGAQFFRIWIYHPFKITSV